MRDDAQYKCAAAISPNTDISFKRSYQHNSYSSNSYKRDVYEYFISDEFDWSDISMKDEIKNIDVPLLVFHNEMEGHGGVGNSRVFEKYMKEKGNEIKYVEVEGVYSVLYEQEHRIQFLKEIEIFFEKHLKEN